MTAYHVGVLALRWGLTGRRGRGRVDVLRGGVLLLPSGHVEQRGDGLKGALGGIVGAVLLEAPTLPLRRIFITARTAPMSTADSGAFTSIQATTSLCIGTRQPKNSGRS